MKSKTFSLNKRIYLITLTCVIIAITFLCLSNKNVLFKNVENGIDLYSYSNEVIFFSRDTCPYCSLAVNILTPMLQEKGITLMYFDTDKMRNDELFDQILSDFNVTEIPTLVYVKNGTYVDSLVMFDEQGKLDTSLVEKMLLFCQ